MLRPRACPYGEYRVSPRIGKMELMLSRHENSIAFFRNYPIRKKKTQVFGVKAAKRKRSAP